VTEELTQLLITQLAQRQLSTLGPQRGVPHHPLLPLGTDPPAEDQPKFVFHVLGHPAADRHFPLLALDLDYSPGHLRTRSRGTPADRP
jgi:hypothetical protein